MPSFFVDEGKQVRFGTDESAAEINSNPGMSKAMTLVLAVAVLVSPCRFKKMLPVAITADSSGIILWPTRAYGDCHTSSSKPGNPGDRCSG